MLDLDKRSITYLPGVGPKKADILQKEAGISSYEDLLFYFPYKYIDRSRFYKVAEISGNMPWLASSRMVRARSIWSGSRA